MFYAHAVMTKMWRGARVSFDDEKNSVAVYCALALFSAQSLFPPGARS